MCRCRCCSTLNFEIQKFCAEINSEWHWGGRVRRVCETRKLYSGLNTYYFVPKNIECVFFSRFSQNPPRSISTMRYIFYSFIDVSRGHTIVYGLFADILRRDTHTPPHCTENKNWCRKIQLNWKLQVWLLCGAAVANTSALTATTTASNKMGKVEASGNYCEYFISLVGRRAFLLNSSFACISINTIPDIVFETTWVWGLAATAAGR